MLGEVRFTELFAFPVYSGIQYRHRSYPDA